MARTEKYFVGPQLLGEIRQTITRVAGMPDRTSGVSLPVRLQELPRRGGGGQLQLGTAMSAWPKDSLADVALLDQGEALQEYADTPPNVIEDCVNKLIDVGDGDVVIIGKIGSRWYLVNAECG